MLFNLEFFPSLSLIWGENSPFSHSLSLLALTPLGALLNRSSVWDASSQRER